MKVYKARLWWNFKTVFTFEQQGRVGVSVLDVRSGESWSEAWQACEEGMGVPSVLVNIAGIKGEENWETLFDVNVVRLRIVFLINISNIYLG